ncbi:hypothetical protein DZD18_12540 [Rhodobacteraceae bacterium W635]|nr:hypothetical protein DZD18_12540 [Rhodobacteraceae bacterium W635]
MVPDVGWRAIFSGGVARTRSPISGEPAEAPERILAAEYAERHGIEVIKTYPDCGNRKAFGHLVDREKDVVRIPHGFPFVVVGAWGTRRGDRSGVFKSTG